MTEPEINILENLIKNLNNKMDNNVAATIRVEGKLKGHNKYITECYRFREEQLVLNKEISNKILIAETNEKFIGSDRRRKAIAFDRFIRVLSLVISVAVAVFVGLKAF